MESTAIFSLRFFCEHLDGIEALGTKRKVKLEALDAICLSAKGRLWLKQFYLQTYDPYRNYYLSLPTKGWDYGHAGIDDVMMHDNFRILLSILDQCADRTRSGKDAKDAILKIVVNGFTPEVAKWIVRMINRDLKMRISGNTLKKFFPDTVKEFGCQLAESYEGGDVSQDPELAWLAQPKIDGLRCVVMLDKDEVSVVSRNGKPIYHYDHIVEQLRGLGMAGYVIDGEIKAVARADDEDDFAASQSAAMSKKDTGRVQTLHVFDLIPLAEFKTGKTTQPQVKRLQILANFLREGNHPNVVQLPIEFVRTEAEVLGVGRKFLDMGYEGAVIKDPAATYAMKRTKSWLKVKFKKDADCVITGVNPGEEGKEFENTMGAIQVMHPNGAETCVGSGYDIPTRHDLWERRKEIIGQVMEVQFQNLTPKGKMRFPVFHRMRLDK